MFFSPEKWASFRKEYVLFVFQDDSDSSAPHLKGLELWELESSAQEQILPFIRICALFRHHMFNVALPVIPLEELEFPSLMRFLLLSRYVFFIH